MPQPERVAEIAKIHEAMEASAGDLTAAAKLLGKDRTFLQKQIHKCPELKLRWATSVTPTTLPPEEETESTRGELMRQSDAEVAALMKREESSFRRGLTQMGVIGPSQELAVAFQQFGGWQYRNLLKMIAGGLGQQFLALQQEIVKLTAELDAGGREMMVITPGTFEAVKRFVPLTTHREKILRDDRARLIEQMQRMSDRAHKASLTQAVIQHKLEGRQRAAKPKGYLSLGNSKVVNLPMENAEHGDTE